MADTPILGVIFLLYGDEWMLNVELPGNRIRAFPNHDPLSFASPEHPEYTSAFEPPLPLLDVTGSPLHLTMLYRARPPMNLALDAVFYCKLEGPLLSVGDFVPQILLPTGLEQPARNDLEMRLKWMTCVIAALERSNRIKRGSTLHFLDYVVNKAQQLAQRPDGPQIAIPEGFANGNLPEFPAWQTYVQHLLSEMRHMGEAKQLR